MGNPEVSPARKALVDAIYGDYYDTLVCAGDCVTPCATRCPSADDLIDAYAHELAEKIRKMAEAENHPGSGYTPDYWNGTDQSADLIDPEVA